jgi:hypothetical protein
MKPEPDPFRQALHGAALRMKVCRSGILVRSILPWACGGAVLAALMTGWPVFAGAGRWILALSCLGLLGGLILPFLIRSSPKDAALALDRERKLPDCALALIEVGGVGAWQPALFADAMRRIEASTPPAWPPEVRRIAGTLALVALFGAAAILWVPAPEEPDVPPNAVAGSLDSYQDVLKDWTRVVDSGAAPEAMTEAARDLKEALEKAGQSPRESLVKIGKLEDRLASQLASLESLEALLPALAEALSATNPRAAAALAKGDLSAAASAMANEPPLSNPAPKAMEQLARQLSEAGFDNLAGAARQLSSKKEPGDSQDAMQNLARALSQADALKQAEKMMQLAQMQMAAARQGMSNSSEAGLDDVPKLSEKGSPGQGAGAGANPGGAPIGENFQDPAVLAPLSGQSDPGGETAVEVMPSNEGREESARTARSQTTGTAGSLSEEAVESEALPVAHRATIRRYFESIRSP